MTLFLNSCEENDVSVAEISELNCSQAVFSAEAVSGTSFTATATVPYTGGNGAAYDAGEAVASTGVTGLTATLAGGTLATGAGSAVFTLTGTPATEGTAVFEISVGGRSCSLSLPVKASAAGISTLEVKTAAPAATESVAYTGSFTLAYTGGNGGAYTASTVTSTGVEGLTATLAEGQLANGEGTLAYTLSGTPTSDGTAIFNISFGGKSCTVTVAVAAATSGTDQAASDTVKIAYSGTGATVSNGYADQGVSVAVSGADVVVTATSLSKEIVYLLSGTATKGSFKIYSDYKFNLTLQNLNLTNTAGPAINIQSGKKATVSLPAGTASTLTDGATYASSSEDQKGTLFSEGQLVFTGTGALTVSGNNKHGIVSDDYISVSQATITVKSAAKDAIHTNDYFSMDSGTLTLTASGDGIEVEEGYALVSGGKVTINSVGDGIKTSYSGTDATISPYIAVKGGTLNITTTGEKGNALKSKGYTAIGTAETLTLTVSGKGSKAIKTSGDLTISSGTLKLSTTGAAFYDTSDADIAAPAGINCDGNLVINGGTLVVSSTGAGAKGITVDGTSAINGGNISITASGAKFTYSNALTSEAKGFKSDGAFIMTNGELNISATDDGLKSETSVTISNGTLNITKSTEGVEAPLITFEGGVSNIVSSDDGINATKGTVNGGTESNDGSHLYIKGGIVIVTGSDAIDSNGNITISGGTTIVCGPTNQPEEGVDFNGTFLINGGNVIIAGSNSMMTKAMGTASAQVGLYIKSGSQLPASSLLHIENASGTEMVTFKPKNAVYYFHFSNAAMAKNTQYKIYFGGAYSGGSFVGGSSGWGMYTGGTYSSSGATLKATTTTSASATVNTVTF